MFSARFLPVWFFLTGIMLAGTATAQNNAVEFKHRHSFYFTGTYSAYTPRFDKLDRPYIYVAAKELGLVIFEISPALQLQPVDTFPVQSFSGLTVNDLCQQGNYLYLALGNFNGLFTQKAGLAVVDISDPAQAFVAGQWTDAGFNKGAAAVLVAGPYAYLGAMEKGVIILDITDPGQPEFVSSVLPDLNWPAPPGPFTTPHARGLALRDTFLYVGFDAGGMRVVNVTDKQYPFEAARYINPNMYSNVGIAYNNIALAGEYALAAIDYCGLDVIEISDPVQPVNTAWTNPWACTLTSWNGSPGHTNQLVTARNDSLVFLSGADTEVLAVDVGNPETPVIAGAFGAAGDSIGTWGVDVRDTLLALAMGYNPVNVPFIARFGGLRLLSWDWQTASGTNRPHPARVPLNIAPNPSNGIITIRTELTKPGAIRLLVMDPLGCICLSSEHPDCIRGANELSADCSGLPGGCYFLLLRHAEGSVCAPFLILRE